MRVDGTHNVPSGRGKESCTPEPSPAVQQTCSEPSPAVKHSKGRWKVSKQSVTGVEDMEDGGLVRT